MTPGARLQAAIDILSSIGRTRAPADRVFDGWARSSRYAGSKDRAAVSELVFTVLRHRSELATALGSEEPRLLALGAVAKSFLAELGITTVSHTLAIGPVRVPEDAPLPKPSDSSGP